MVPGSISKVVPWYAFKVLSQDVAKGGRGVLQCLNLYIWEREVTMDSMGG